MTQIAGLVVKVAGAGGPFAYVIYVDAFATKVVVGIATLAQAMNGVRDDVAAAVPPTENIERVNVNATSR